jgi:hypothetical protein
MDSRVSAYPGSGTNPPTKLALTFANSVLITPWIAVEAVPARSTLHPLKFNAKPDRTETDNLLRNMSGTPL